MSSELETTCKMQRDELLALINTTASPELQRITSEIPSVTLNDLLRPEPAPPLERCEPPPGSGTRIQPRLAIVAISFAVTILVGIATGLLLT